MGEGTVQRNAQEQKPEARSQKPELQVLALAALRESKTNPRSAWGAEGLKELADSMRAHGVLEPLLVRPIRRESGVGSREWAEFEVIVGARRLRAAKLAKLETVPAIVRELTDVEAMEIQIIENLQREDIQPLDEGLGYRALIEQAGYDVAKVAEKIGKSQSYVYQRLKLADLTKPAQKALAEGQISAGHAVQIARLQPSDQAKALEMIAQSDKYDDPITVRDLGNWIALELHRSLDKAPWKKDDASLLPGAGACTICPKRAGTTPALYPDLKPQTCTDPGCFEAKMKAFIEAAKAEALKAPKVDSSRSERDGNDKPAGAEGAVALVELSEDYSPRTHHRGKKIPSNALLRRDWKEIGAKDKKCKSIRQGILIDGLRIGQSLQICIEPKCTIHRMKSEESAIEKRYKAKQKAKEQKRRLATRANEQIFQAIRAKVPAKLARADLELIAGQMFARLMQEHQRPLFNLLGWEVEEKKAPWGGKVKDWDGTAAAKISKLSEAEINGFLMSSALIGCVHVGEYSTPDRSPLLATAKRYGIDTAKIERQIQAETKAKAKNKPSRVAKSSKKKSAKKARGLHTNAKSKRRIHSALRVKKGLMEKPNAISRAVRKSRKPAGTKRGKKA